MKESAVPMPESGGLRVVTQLRTAFGGYDRSPAALYGVAENNGFCDMYNMSSDTYPYPTLRQARYTVRTLPQGTTLTGIGAKEKLFYTTDDGFFYDGVRKGTLAADAEKRYFVNFDRYVLIFPDRAYYDTEQDRFGKMNFSPNLDLSGAKLQSGTLAGEQAAMNTLYLEDVDFSAIGFCVGDGVTVRCLYGTTALELRAVIREMTTSEMRFDAGTFSGLNDAIVTGLSREIPPMTYAFRCGNRLFGCVGNRIYASVEGNPFNFYVYDGKSTDAWESQTDLAGTFTAGCAFRDHPTFFCEDAIVRVLGVSPSGFQLSVTEGVPGVAAGCADSVRQLSNVLYYVSAAGVMAYTGNAPTRISEPLGTDLFPVAFCAAGADGRRYFCGLRKPDGAALLVAYDTEKEVWTKEDALEVCSFVPFGGNLLAACADRIVTVGTPRGPVSDWVAERTPAGGLTPVDFCRADMGRLIARAFSVRLRHDAGTVMRFFVSKDGETPTEVPTSQIRRDGDCYLLTLSGSACRRVTLRLSGNGPFTLFGIAFTYAVPENRR